MNMRRYFVELGSAIIAYGLVLTGSILAIKNGWVEGDWRVPVAILPMLPMGLAAWAILRQLQRLDELQRRQQLEALAFAFAGTAMLTFTYGFLEGVGLPKLSMFYVWPLMAALWFVGGLIACRRYR